jgi:acyl carrier protein
MPTDVEPTVRALVAKHFGLPADEIDFGMRVEDVGDSLKLSELVIALEQKLGVRLSDSALARVRTLGDLLELVRAQIA